MSERSRMHLEAVPLYPGPGRTRRSRHRSGMPFRSYSPATSKVRREPATRSFTVWETSTSDGPAFAATRAPIETVMPAHLPSMSSHSPVWRPARTSIPSSLTSSVISSAQRIARAVRRRSRRSRRRRCRSPPPATARAPPGRSRGASRQGPSSDGLRATPASLEPTMSVNSTVARIVSYSGAGRSTPRNRRTRSRLTRLHPAQVGREGDLCVGHKGRDVLCDRDVVRVPSSATSSAGAGRTGVHPGHPSRARYG